MSCPGRHVPIDDTRLWLVERGEGFPIVVLHGGPGLDHHEFGDYLDPIADAYRLILLDQRSQGRSDRTPEHTWTLERMAQDVIMVARYMGLDRFAVLGHSYGAFVALQNAIDFPGMAAATIISSGIPSMRFMDVVEEDLERFEPAELREQVMASWEREATVQTVEEAAALIRDQWPFHFANPRDKRIEEYVARSSGECAPDVLRHFSVSGYGGIEAVARLPEVTSPTLVLAGRHDRVCTVEAAQVKAGGIAGAELVVFEESGHMAFVEESERYVAVVRDFLDRSVA